MKYIIIVCVLLFSIAVNGQSLTANGNWTLSIPSTLLTEAGSDYNQNFASNSNQITIDITGTSLLCIGILAPRYQIQVNKLDNNWNNQLELYVRRTGNGSTALTCITGCSISNGTTYIQIENTPKYFFETKGCWVNVPIQYELRGVSTLVPADIYNIDVVYTLYNL